MYTPKAFQMSGHEALFDFVSAHPLGLLVLSGQSGLEGVHLPFLVEGSTDAPRLIGHMARANSAFDERLEGSDVLVAFSGEASYISPSFYPSKKRNAKVVPTWNYSAVHMSGTVHFHLEPDWLLSVVRKLTDRFEADMEEPWSVDDAPADYVEAMTRAIVGVEILVTSLEGKAKQSQNRSPEDQAGVRRALSAGSFPRPLRDPEA